MDVNSLYTSIGHSEGLNAVHWFLDKYTDFTSIQILFCLTLLKLILTKNFFLFADQFYIQKVGTAMGSNVAPPYANIFMAAFEEKFVYTHHLFQQHCLYWKRYIDDVFLIWRGDEISLSQFFNEINLCIPNLTFSITKDSHSVSFFGHIGFRMDPAKVNAVLEWERPEDLKALQRFLGVAHYYRKFIKDFSVVTKPLTDMTKRGTDFSAWSTAAENQEDWVKYLPLAEFAINNRTHESTALGLLYDAPNSVDQAEKILLALCQGQEAQNRIARNLERGLY
ncbi:unnamed protein product [Ranitomeya imitator]|uniref:ribonuclease H n=1 Tax=Ranitomeya imitator TaxID=111125 RepID=A0ABN9LN26_9NEOB|nr:unnamed protein product [Ranitomeya imitator]